MVPTFARAMWHAFVYWIEQKPVIAPKPVAAWRRSVCAKCDQNTKTLWPQCKICVCALEPKTLLSSESCPIDKWPALSKPLSENSALTTDQSASQ